MNSRLIVGIVIILLGLSFLFELPILKVLIALFIIYIGFKVLRGKPGDIPFTSDISSKSSEDFIKRVLIFSGMKTKYDSKNFKGAEFVAVFSGGELDLSKVSTNEKELELNLVAVLGGLKVKVPKSWEVKTEGVGVLGAFNNKTAKPSKTKVKVLVKGAAVLGAVDIDS